MLQTSLFDHAEAIQAMDLSKWDVILLNSSGGKDSQTMIHYVVGLAETQGIDLGRLVVVHADLGRVEWKGTRELAELQAKHYGLRFEAISRPQGDLLEHIIERGMWPSSTNRYCTSDHKRGQVQKVITQLHREFSADTPGRTCRVLNCMGLRAQESPARAKKIEFEKNDRASTQSREVYTWLPILDWSEVEVWDSIKASGVPYHPAYDLGMPRLSCVFCVFAPKAALILAGQHNRELLTEYVQAEKQMGHTFRVGTSMEDIQSAVEAGEQVGELAGDWNM